MLVLDYIISNWTMLISGILLGFTVGILTGFFGAGGGFIVTPALNIFLGFEMNMAVGTSAFQIMGTSAFALYHNIDRRLMGSRIALFVAAGIPVGTFSGFYVVQQLKGKAAWNILGRTVDPVNFSLLAVFALFLFAIAGWLIYDNFILRKDAGDDESSHVGLLFPVRLPPVRKFRTIPAIQCCSFNSARCFYRVYERAAGNRRRSYFIAGAVLSGRAKHEIRRADRNHAGVCLQRLRHYISCCRTQYQLSDGRSVDTWCRRRHQIGFNTSGKSIR